MLLGVCLCVLFPPVHPLDVVLVVCFKLLALQFESVSDQPGLRRPGLSTQTDLLRDLKSLHLCWLCGRESRVTG